MGTEIERKFLVTDAAILHGRTGQRIVQGYFVNGKTSVRIRVIDDNAILTIKGAAVDRVRAEFEYAVPVTDAPELLTLCRWPPIDKVRYTFTDSGHVWEVDVFEGANAPLVIAEVELDRPDEPVVLPAWVGAEVTDDHRYYNGWLTEHPYSGWSPGR